MQNKKATVNSKIYYVKDWTKNKITEYLKKKKKESGNEIWSVNNI